MATNIPNFCNMKESKQFFKYLWRYSSWKCWPPVVRPKIKYCRVICPYPLACPWLSPTHPLLWLRISLIQSKGFVMAQHIQVVGYHWNRLDEHVLNPWLLFTITSLCKTSFIQPGNKHCVRQQSAVYPIPIPLLSLLSCP